MERAACRCSDKEKIYDGSSVLSNADSHWYLSGLVRFWLLVSSFLRFMTLIKAMSLSISAAGSLNPSDSMHIRHSHKPLLCLYSLYFISQTSQIVRYHFNCWLFLFFKLFAPTSRWRLSRLCFDLVVALQTPTLFETQIIQKSQLNENGVYTVYA